MSFAGTRGLENSLGAPFALAVLGGAALTGFGTFLLLVLDDAAYSGVPGALFAGFLAFLLASVVISLSAALIGLPLTWLLARLGLEAPVTYPLAGFLAGGAVVTLFPVLTGDLRGDSILEFLPFAWAGALPGCVCGIIWWLSFRRHMQDPGDQRG